MSPTPASSVTSPRSDDDVNGRKATLFCQDCGHTSPVDGDWRVRTVGSRRRLRCPECRNVVDERRATERPRDPPVQRYVDVWHRYWSAWTTLLADARADC